MILSVESMSGYYIKLREVRTEEEAFAEIRRYLEVNSFYSDTTTVYKKTCKGRNEIESLNKFVCVDHCAGVNFTFQIHYENEPEYESVSDAVARSSFFAHCYNTKDKPGRNPLEILRYINQYGSTIMSWFPDEYDRYVSDLIKRVGEICH